MEILLMKDFPQLGYMGDMVKVRRGYARNFLVPRGIGIEVGSSSAKTLKHTVNMVGAQRAKKKTEAEQLKDQIEKVTLEFALRSTEHGRSFGSVSQREIEVALKEKGFVLDRKQIRIQDQIKSAGKHAVQIKLHADVIAQIPVNVTVEVAGAVKTAEEAGVKGKGKGRKGSARAAKKEEDADKTPDSSETASE